MQEKVVDAVIQECKGLGYTISCKEAAVRRTVNAVSAITVDAMCTKRKWMIDSGCAMDLVSRAELSPGELAMPERVRRIKFNTANGNTTSESAIKFNIEALSECVLVRILESTPGVLSKGMRCIRLGYSFHWISGKDPMFIRPDNVPVKLKVIGDIPCLTEAMSTAVPGRSIEPYQTLPAMPAPTTLGSRWTEKLGMDNGSGTDTDDLEESGHDGREIVSRMRRHWLFDRHRIVLLVYKWKVGIPDLIQEALSQPWVIEHLASAFPI